jgi:UDP-N-acetylglucosamine acyltransferase
VIHPTAIVDPRAEIDASAEIGPYVVVDGPVHVGPRTRVGPHAVLLGDTRLGADNVLHTGVVLGDVPQDVAFRDAPTGLRIGDRNVFREYSQVHRGTQPDTFTVLGDGNFLMIHAHVAHNCRLASRVIVAGGALVAGHAVVDDDAFISGNCVVHQHVRIGRLSIMRGGSRTSRDVPPFALVDGTHTIHGINRVGVRRAGLDRTRQRALVGAFRILFGERRNLRLAMAEVEAGTVTPEVAEVLAFIRASRRGVAQGPRHGTSPDAEAAEE